MDDLKHYGIIGMKWGVRRFQNPNGSYTAAGLRRYHNAREEYITYKKEYKKAKSDYKEVKQQYKSGQKSKEELHESRDIKQQAKKNMKKAYARGERVASRIMRKMDSLSNSSAEAKIGKSAVDNFFNSNLKLNKK